DGKTIERGTVLLRAGKIQEVGADVKVPAGARVVDAAGGTLMPGIVSAYSQVGLQTGGSRRQSRGPSRGGRGGFRRPNPGGAGASRNEAAKKVAASIYARQDIFH